MFDRVAVDEIKKLRERHLLIRGIVSWMGYRSTTLEYVAEKRFAGESKYSVKQLFLLVVWGVMSFSGAPLRIFLYLGLLISLISAIYTIFLISYWLVFGTEVRGWMSSILLILLFGGINSFGLGIIGEYLPNNYSETKNRSIYVAVETL